MSYPINEMDAQEEFAIEPFCAVCGDPLPYAGACCPNDCPEEYQPAPAL